MFKAPVLSPSQVRDFHDRRFLLVRGALDASSVAQIDAWTHELLARPEESGKHWVYHENSSKDPSQKLICRIENIVSFHDGFRMLAEVLRTPVGQLLGEEAVLFKEKVNFKMPGGNGFEPHQDAQAGWAKYADYFVNVLVSIDETTIENGCIEMVGGHDKRRLFRLWEPLTETDMEDMTFVPCPTRPGDVVFFDHYVPHRSAPNLSNGSRRVYYATYNRQSAGDHMADYYADKHKSYPPDVDRDPTKTYIFRV